MLKSSSSKFVSFMFVFLCVLFSRETCYGKRQSADQQKESLPEVGKPCPDFELNRVTHYPKQSVKLADFKGKWLFLDFWFPGCSSCIKSFPKISQFQSDFPQIQFLLIGLNGGRHKNSERIFEKLAAMQDLKISVAYDSLLNKRWSINSMPHIIVIDPEGIVRFITDGRDINKEKLGKLLNGEDVSFYDIKLTRPKFDPTSTMEEMNVYSSLFTKWNGEKPEIGYDVNQYVNIVTYPGEKYQPLIYAALNLKMLYFFAFFGDDTFRFIPDSRYGQIYPSPLLELKDKSLFDYSYEEGKGLYNYSLRLPKDQLSNENIIKYMQQDFERAFGYRAFVDDREMPIWKLVVQKDAKSKLLAKGGEPYNSGKLGSHAVGFTVKNTPMSELIVFLFSYVSEKKDAIPFLDYTGVTENIDFSIEADLTNLQDIRTALQKKGLDIVEGKKLMKVLVIQDRGM